MPSFRFASATGSGLSLIVTCSDLFAGKTITCTNGTKTYTRTCPSTSPYEVVFKGVVPGTWTVSGVVEGTTYSQQVVITDFDVTLTAGFSYKEWVTRGGLDPTDYTDLEDVFADEVAVRRLMTIHASADYLIEKVTDDVDEIDDFTANDTAMKWIGLRDYVCDGLTAITGVKAKFMASQYWERYLKDHVPVMTSNTAPYGTAFADSLLNSNYAIYYPFTGDSSKKWYSAQNKNAHWLGYEFVNPICVKRFTVGIDWSFGSFVIQGSNDGTTYTDISQSYTPSTGDNITDTLDNDTYYRYLRIYVPANNSGIYFGINLLQFYGRSLNVSVPVMTSNTAPYGEAFASSIIGDGRIAYCAFNNVYSTGSAGSNIWHSLEGVPQFVGYKSTSAYCVKYARLRTSSGHKGPKVAKLQGSNNSTNGTDGTWTDIGDFVDCPNTATWYFKQYDSNDNSYLWYRLYVTEANIAYTVVDELQLYGIDYSEREFAEGSTMKYLYDHGLELETIDITGTVTKDDDYITLSAANAQASHTLDLTPYDLLRGKVGDHMSGTTALIAGTTATANMTAANAPNNESLDVSSVNASLATGAKMTGAGVCDITELWLE